MNANGCNNDSRNDGTFCSRLINVHYQQTGARSAFARWLLVQVVRTWSQFVASVVDGCGNLFCMRMCLNARGLQSVFLLARLQTSNGRGRL